jgi:hypothetical protein
MRGFIFKGCLDEAKIREWVRQLIGDSPVFHIVEDLDDYRPGIGVPDDLKRKGRLFGAETEVRYERVGEVFECLMLTERELGRIDISMAPVPGDWEVEDAEHILIPVNTPHVNPLFKEYPNHAKRVSIRCYRDGGMAVFTRMRRFEP